MIYIYKIYKYFINIIQYYSTLIKLDIELHFKKIREVHYNKNTFSLLQHTLFYYLLSRQAYKFLRRKFYEYFVRRILFLFFTWLHLLVHRVHQFLTFLFVFYVSSLDFFWIVSLNIPFAWFLYTGRHYLRKCLPVYNLFYLFY